MNYAPYDLKEEEKVLVKELAKILLPEAEKIRDEFISRLLENQECKDLLAKLPEERVKEIIEKVLIFIQKMLNLEEDFEKILMHIGLIHVRGGVKPRHMIYAWNLLRCILFEKIASKNITDLRYYSVIAELTTLDALSWLTATSRAS